MKTYNQIDIFLFGGISPKSSIFLFRNVFVYNCNMLQFNWLFFPLCIIMASWRRRKMRKNAVWLIFLYLHLLRCTYIGWKFRLCCARVREIFENIFQFEAAVECKLMLETDRITEYTTHVRRYFGRPSYINSMISLYKYIYLCKCCLVLYSEQGKFI